MGKIRLLGGRDHNTNGLRRADWIRPVEELQRYENEVLRKPKEKGVSEGAPRRETVNGPGGSLVAEPDSRGKNGLCSGERSIEKRKADSMEQVSLRTPARCA